MSGIEALLRSVLAVFAVALLVRLLVRDRERLSFASVLVAVGLLVSALGLSFELELTSELVLAGLLPTIIFHGTTTIDVRRLRRNAPLVAVLTLVGLPVSVVVLGIVGRFAFGFQTVIALLFAAVVLPTDPAATGDRVVVEKRGRAGAAVRWDGESASHDGFDVEPVDSTGAGDAFAAGFIAARLDGADHETALARANACGALTTAALGAWVAPAPAAVDALLEGDA